MSKEFKVLDLFCGAGGLSWGLHKNSSFETVVALDFDVSAANTFKRNMPSTEVVIGFFKVNRVKDFFISFSK